jgi:hypothetical protein
MRCSLDGTPDDPARLRRGQAARKLSKRQNWVAHFAGKSMDGMPTLLLIRNLLKTVDIPAGPEYLARAAPKAVLALDDSAAAVSLNTCPPSPTAATGSLLSH